MTYEVLVLDLDGTLTNSRKEISTKTKDAIKKLHSIGKKVVLASGRPTPGVLPLAKELDLKNNGGYILPFNGARIIDCHTNEAIYNKTVSHAHLEAIYDMIKETNANLITYTDTEIISAFEVNKYTQIESQINKMPIKSVDNFLEYIDFPINKLVAPGDPDLLVELEAKFKERFHSNLNIFRSEPHFLEIMPAQIDKAHSLLRLLNSIGFSSDQMICCGDGYNDITMIECAGLGVAMANAQSEVIESADFVTASNNEDGIAQVIEMFML